MLVEYFIECPVWLQWYIDYTFFLWGDSFRNFLLQFFSIFLTSIKIFMMLELLTNMIILGYIFFPFNSLLNHLYILVLTLIRCMVSLFLITRFFFFVAVVGIPQFNLFCRLFDVFILMVFSNYNLREVIWAKKCQIPLRKFKSLITDLDLRYERTAVLLLIGFGRFITKIKKLQRSTYAL